jgi:diaminohydroxyphosphoribosylaminopyrimidine deaminase/5-amino-6-(5-phosphoribosylamino)uracil reductase
MQGSESVEVQAARLGGPAARGSTAYLNLETGDCHGDDTSLRALIDCGVERVVVGLQNPLRHTRGLAIKVPLPTTPTPGAPATGSAPPKDVR